MNDLVDQGWLRLTSAVRNEQGVALWTGGAPMTADHAVSFEFEYVTWGSKQTGNFWGGEGRGADGISFFLYDASKNMAGAGFGGDLGYCGGNGAYLGLGLDEWGNFSGAQAWPSANTFCGDQAGGFENTQANYSHRNHLVMRGPADAAVPYPLVRSVPALFNISQSDPNPTNNDPALRPQETGVRVLLIPKVAGGYEVSLETRRAPGNWETKISNADFPYPAPVDGLRMGVAASNGGENNIHEIRRVRAGSPANITTKKTLDTPHPEKGQEVIYTVRFTNSDIFQGTTSAAYAPALNLAHPSGLTLSDDLPPELEDVSWSCAVSNVGDGGSRCPAPSADSALSFGDGSGFVLDGLGAQLTFTVRGRLNVDTCGAVSVQNTAVARFDAQSLYYDVFPDDNTDTAGFVGLSVCADMHAGAPAAISVTAGQLVEVQSICTNAGPDSAAAARCTVSGAPAGASFACDPDATLPLLEPTHAISCITKFTPTDPGEITLITQALSDTHDTQLDNNHKSTVVTVLAPPIPSVDMQASAPLTIAGVVGEKITVASTCTNAGIDPAPAATCSVSGAPAGASVVCEPSITLEPSESLACETTFTPTAPGEFTLTTEARSDGEDIHPDNNAADTRIKVSAATVAPVPTLGEWALVLLSSLLAAAAAWRIRRARAH